MLRCLVVGAGLAVLACGAIGALAAPAPPADRALAAYEEYRGVVARTAGMVHDGEARRLAGARGLHVLNVTWEDTARFQNSAVGPNISDVTIQVHEKHPTTGEVTLTCMPVIR